MATRFEYYNTGWASAGNVFDAVWLAQTFTPSTAHVITSVKLQLTRTGLPGTLTVSIRATDVDGLPTGSDLCSGTIDGNSVPEDPSVGWFEITFGAGCALSASTKYAIVIRAPAGDDPDNRIRWLADISTPTYAGGNGCRSEDSGTNWTALDTTDFMFEEWGYIAYVRSLSTAIGMVANLGVEAGLTHWLVVASRDGGSIKTKSDIGASWSTAAKDDSGAAIQSAWLAQFDNRLVTLAYQNAGFGYSNVNDIASNWAAPQPNFPNLPQRFTDMFTGRDAGDDPALYFLTPTGMYYLDVFSNFVFGVTEVTWEEDDISGKKGLYWKGDHYIAVGKGIYKISTGVVSLVGPDMDDGFPEHLQGTVTDMIGVGFWLGIAIDGGAANKSGIYKRYITGNHWHPIYVGAVNTPIQALVWDSGTLYFGEGSDVKSLPLPNTTDNVKLDSSHIYGVSGTLVYPYFHSEFEAMPKTAQKLRAVTEDCNPSETITISYRIDEESSWTALGSFEASPRPPALPFPASGDAIGISFERIQFKVEPARGSSTQNSPRLVSLVLEYRVIPPVLWGWDLRVVAQTEGAHRGQDIIDAMATAMASGTLLTFYPSGDKSGTKYLVEVKGMPRNEKGSEFGAEGLYALSVQQVVE